MDQVGHIARAACVSGTRDAGEVGQVRYGSVCSGVEAATVAWDSLGWTPVFFSEIEPFPCAVLKHYYPAVPNYGDMTKFAEWPNESIDVLVGGTPCQSYSVAGLRAGLADPRGNLMLTYLAIADRYRPEWLVWENVPGVLSSNGGRDFGTLLGMLAELGYGFAYRVLDAQYFGVAQRRRRVFVVANARSWQRAAAVLFESHSLQGHPAPSRETREGVAETFADRFGISHENHEELAWPAEVASTLNAAFGSKQGLEDQHALGGAPLFVPAVAGSLTAKGPGAMGAPEVDAHHFLPVVQTMGDEDIAPCLIKRMEAATGTTRDAQIIAVAQPVATAMQVRRLTPVECERLQGFSDGYTNIPWRGKPKSPDGPRYKALGNSMAVPVMKWIGQRIQKVSEL